MTDRELLVLAAKAAGIKPPHGQGGYIRRDGGFCYYLDCEGKTSRIWNPLTDDGDALRLAVRCGMHVSQQLSYVSVTLPHGPTATRGVSWNQSYDEDPLSATRRAIVRAAAAIGESMP